MIYLLKLNLETKEKISNSKFYYHILWAILSIFDDDDKIYNNILKISYSTKENLQVRLSIYSQEAYTQVLQKLLERQNLSLSINNTPFELQTINFDFDIFQPENINFNDFNKFKIRYLSPSFVRNKNILYTMPNPNKFIYSSFSKLNKIYEWNIDWKEFKHRLEQNIIIWEYKIKTDMIHIKWNNKSWVVGYVWYHVIDKSNQDFMKLLYITLKSMKFVGVGSSARLGLGNVSVFIN